MGEKQSRSVNCGGRAATFVFVALVLLAYGPIPGRVWAQGNTAQRDGAAGTAAQREPAGAEASQEPSQVTAEALSLRYRFIEKYSLTEDPNHPELITQYRVGIRETQKTEREKSQGAPDRLEISRQTIYTERAARVGKLGEMVSAVRRYDRFQRKDPGAIHPPTPPLFEGLTVWMRRQSGRKPLVLSLTSERPLRDFEFTEISKQVFVPQLPAMFPQTPRRVGDTWSIPRTAAQYLVGEIPEPDEYALTGTLVEVRRSAAGPGLTAVIGLAGQMNLSFGLSALKAQIHFAFEPAPGSPAAIAPAPGAVAGDDASAKSRAGNDAGVVDARGRIARVLMLWGVSDVLPDSDGRLKQTATYELNLERRFAPATNEAAGPNAALIVPDPAPTPDESNSWLMFDDPQGRFHFLHPQTLLLTSRTMDPKLLEFVDQSPGPGAGQDVFLLGRRGLGQTETRDLTRTIAMAAGGRLGAAARLSQRAGSQNRGR
jgi:hypothetical protein